jgi:TatD DNase family protein
MSLVDIGVNLFNPQFDEDRLNVIEESLANGVVGLIITGTDLEKSKKIYESVKELKGRFPFLYFTAGVHPHQARYFDPKRDSNRLRIMLTSDRCVALGECGLDFNRKFSTPEEQLVCFEEQIKVAIITKRNMFIHERDAFEQVFELLQKYEKELSEAGVKVVIHCFTGNKTQVEQYLSLGFNVYIGITGFICDEERNKELLEALPLIPPDRMMVETDAPFMKPFQVRDRRNAPKHLGFVVQKIADTLKVTFEAVADVTTQNAINFFNLTDLPKPTGFWVKPEPKPARSFGGDNSRGGYQGSGRGRGRGDGSYHSDRGGYQSSRGRGRGNHTWENQSHMKLDARTKKIPNIGSMTDFPVLESNTSYYDESRTDGELNTASQSKPSGSFKGNWSSLFK